MNREEIFAVWSNRGAVLPDGAPNWGNWAKPILFAAMDPSMPSTGHTIAGGAWTSGAAGAPAAPPDPTPAEPSPNADWAPSPSWPTAVIVDLPGPSGVAMGMELARRGYRPVPLYNGCPGAATGPTALVDVNGIIAALCRHTETLGNLPLDHAAPPAFLLDSLRGAPGVKASPNRFDNRWVVLPQDFPSANLLLSRGISSAVIVQTKDGQPAEDLRHVLLRWQNAGMTIQGKPVEADREPAPITVTRPRGFGALWYLTLTLAGFRRNSAGGFGSVIPMSSSSG